MAALLMVALLGCGSTAFDPSGPHDWSCEFIWTCGATGTADTFEFDDLTSAEMWTIASDWSSACDQLAKIAVHDGQCPFVFCAAPCATTDGGGS